MYSSIFKAELFKDSVVLVTGGGTGIGKCVAFELASLGAMVIVAGRRLELLEQTVNEIRKDGYKADSIVMNIRKEDQVRAAIKELVQRHGFITHLVNNGGGQFLSSAEDISDKGWRAVVDTNLNGTWNVTRAVFDLCMRPNGGGSIVCVIANFWNGMPMMAHTSAARAGVDNLVKTLAIEWGSNYGIRINCVAPGTIVGNGIMNYPESVRDTILKPVSWKNPTGRLGTEGEVSSAICYLLSPAASFINGCTLKVDGGTSLIGFSMSSMRDDLFNTDEPHKITAFVGLSEEKVGKMPQPMQKVLKRYQRKAKL